MTSTVSPLYRTGSLFRVRPMWRPDGGFKEAKRKRAATPQTKRPIQPPKVEHSRAEVLARLRQSLDGQRQALQMFLRQQVEINERLRLGRFGNFGNREEHLKLAASCADKIKKQQRKILETNVKIAALTADLAPVDVTSSAPPPQEADGASASVELAELSVPLPSERLKLKNLVYSTREGQDVFRALVLDLYGRCAATGCVDHDALQAAHIIPYVDKRSHKVRNGVCFRADVHQLFDRGLISIGPDYVVSVSIKVQSPEYRALHGVKLKLPTDKANWPSLDLFRIRERFLPMIVNRPGDFP